MRPSRVLVSHQAISALYVPATYARKQLSDFNTDSLDVSVSFCERGFDGPGEPQPDAHAHLYVLAEDATVFAAYASFGAESRDLAFTPEQLGEFVTCNREELHHIACPTFFLLREGECVSGGIYVPHQSGFFAIRSYSLDSTYIVRAKDKYAFLVLQR